MSPSPKLCSRSRSLVGAEPGMRSEVGAVLGLLRCVSAAKGLGVAPFGGAHHRSRTLPLSAEGRGLHARVPPSSFDLRLSETYAHAFSGWSLASRPLGQLFIERLCRCSTMGGSDVRGH